MHIFYRATTKCPKIVVMVFLLLAAAGALCKPLIAVNYDMNDYLPPTTASTLALDAMDAEYDGGVPNARVMVKNVTIPEALSYKQALQAVNGVTDVTWLDDAASVEQPLETLDADTVSSYYRDGAALFSVTIAEDKRISAVEDIRALILILTTPSWLEPLVVLGSLGVAILINSGSNLVFGEISFVSNAAGSILQLAVSLDYSIFLLHRFEECRRETPDPREAMVEALCKSTLSILSSGLTTVFLFSPALILLCHSLLEKTRHRSFMPSFRGLGRCVTRLMIPVPLILVVPAYLGSGQNSYYYGSSHIFGPETQLGADMQAIEDVFGKSDTYVLMVPRGSAARCSRWAFVLFALPGMLVLLDGLIERTTKGAVFAKKGE